MKLQNIELPEYTRAQENWNSASHAAGTVFALIAGPFLIKEAVRTGSIYAIISSIIFILSLILLYTGSALYHGLPKSNLKKVLRVMDHNMVFILIMGSYAPYCMTVLRQYSPFWGWSILGLCWTLGIVGIVLNSIDMKKFRIVSMIDYILMGWIIIISFYPLCQSMRFIPGILMLVLGGVSYTIGAVLYGIGGKKNQWFHVVFHFLCLVGSSLMFFSIYFYVIPLVA